MDKSLKELSFAPSFANAQKAIGEVISLLGFSGENDWKLFTDSNGKIRSNATWFMMADGFADKRATYKIAEEGSNHIDFKAYWVKNLSKSVISWIVALTPNFEDELFYEKTKNIGIDFIIPEKADRIIVTLSNNYIIRTLELHEGLSLTQEEIFAKWIQPLDFENKKQTHDILWQSFDLEAVNKTFYKGISSFFVELRQHLSDKKIFSEKHAAFFTNRLIGRVVFCWFLDKKGIINPEMEYFETGDQKSTDYYHTKLETLFFKVLNTPVEDRDALNATAQKTLIPEMNPKNLFNANLDLKTPFLNGGLFEPREHDKFGEADLKFPEDFFDRFFAFLRHYNFTTDESTSSFQQVAIDPEMLGRIFENLLAEQTEETGEQARKAKGAFYTPREIVDYMCRESLREYLKTKIPETDDRDQRIGQLLDSKPHEWRDQQRNYRDDLKLYKKEIISALDELKIIDPACGSGAFPMGMMQLLLQCYERLEPRFDSYTTKLDVIKNNIHGVDIEPMAVEISRLRAWLSIIVDEDADSKKIQPLPNLDFKFVCANSLIPLKKEASGLFDTVRGDDLIEIRDRYFNARSKNSKENLRSKYEKLIGKGSAKNMFSSEYQKQLESYLPFDSENVTQFFDSEFMFGVEGFDIVIGNPPYIRVQEIDESLSEKYKEIYYSATGSYDIYVLFVENGLLMVKPEGILNYIMPHKWINSTYGAGLRDITKNKVKKIISFGAYQVFTASAYTSLIWFQNSNQKLLNYFELSKNLDSNENLSDFLNRLRSDDFTAINNDKLSNAKWLFADKNCYKVLIKIKKQKHDISDVFTKVFQGLKTGRDSLYILHNCKVDNNYIFGYSEEVEAEIKIEKDLTRPVLKGKNIKRYEHLHTDKVVIFPYCIVRENDTEKVKLFEEKEIRSKFPCGYAYLKKHEDTLRDREKRRFDIDGAWFQFSRNQGILGVNRKKIILSEISLGSNMTIDSDGIFHVGQYSMLKNPDSKFSYEFYLAILNSRLMWFFIKNTSSVLRGGFYAYRPDYIKPFSLPEISGSNASVAKDINDKAIEVLEYKNNHPKADTRVIEKEIDQLVYKLYDLTAEEITIVENNN